MRDKDEFQIIFYQVVSLLFFILTAKTTLNLVNSSMEMVLGIFIGGLLLTILLICLGTAEVNGDDKRQMVFLLFLPFGLIPTIFGGYQLLTSFGGIMFLFSATMMIFFYLINRKHTKRKSPNEI